MCWATWREAKEYDRRMREELSPLIDGLDQARETYARMCCVKAINDRPPPPGSPSAIALENVRRRRRERPALTGREDDTTEEPSP